MGMNNTVFLEVIEWFDESGKELVHRIPEEGSGEIKWGARPSASFPGNSKSCFRATS